MNAPKASFAVNLFSDNSISFDYNSISLPLPDGKEYSAALRSISRNKIFPVPAPLANIRDG